MELYASVFQGNLFTPRQFISLRKMARKKHAKPQALIKPPSVPLQSLLLVVRYICVCVCMCLHVKVYLCVVACVYVRAYLSACIYFGQRQRGQHAMPQALFKPAYALPQGVLPVEKIVIVRACVRAGMRVFARKKNSKAWAVIWTPQIHRLACYRPLDMSVSIVASVVCIHACICACVCACARSEGRYMHRRKPSSGHPQIHYLACCWSSDMSLCVRARAYMHIRAFVCVHVSSYKEVWLRLPCQEQDTALC